MLIQKPIKNDRDRRSSAYSIPSQLYTSLNSFPCVLYILPELGRILYQHSLTIAEKSLFLFPRPSAREQMSIYFLWQEKASSLPGEVQVGY